MINLSGTMTTDITVALYRLDPRKDRARVLDPYERQKLGEYLSRHENSILERQFTADLDPDGDFNGSVAFPAQEPGLYFVRAQVDGGKLARDSWFLVTNLGVVTRRSPHEILVYAQNFATGLPAAAVDLDFYQGDRVVRHARTGVDGTYLWKEPSSAAMVLMASAGEDNAYSRLDSFASGDAHDPYRVYLYTDRPIYRPGHEVHVRGIIRRDVDRAYRIPAGQTVQLQIDDAKGATIARPVATVTEYGGFRADFVLPDRAALGDWMVSATLGGGTGRSSFKVAEYRKPEFKVELQPEKTRYTSGDRVRVKVDARYFFGAPVTAARVTWSVYESYYHFDRETFYDVDGDQAPEHYGGMVADGTVALGADGTAWIEFSPGKATHDRDFWIEAEVEDASHRVVSANTDVLVTLGDYWLDLSTDRWGYAPGDPVRVSLTSREYDGDRARPNTPVHAVLRRIDYLEKTEKGLSHYERHEQEVWSQQGVTGPRGELELTLRPPSDGSYELEVSSRDARGDVISASAWFFVSGGEGGGAVYGSRDLTVLLDKAKFVPGSTARVVVTSRYKDASVLLSVDGRRIHSYQVVSLKGTSATVEIPVKPEYFPNVIVTAIAIHDKQLLSDERPLIVQSDDRGLDVHITPERSVYEPGQELECQVRITDKRGRPVQAEFSLGVVDSAIYALAPDTTDKIYDFFYGAEPSYVRTEYSFAPDYSGGRNKDDDPRVRRNFKDTAFWAPLLTTGPDGTAEVSFPLPDNLTAWRFTVRAITRDSKVGEATTEVLSRKPLLVRLEVPRFMVERDTMELSAVVHNETDRAQDVSAAMQVEGLVLRGGGQKQSIAAHDVHRFIWTVEAAQPGTARVTVSARGQGVSDAMELSFPVLPHGVAQVQSGAGEASPVGRWKATVGSDEAHPRLTVYLSPSLAAAAMQGLDYLAAYPYGCVEQTMSAFVPDIVLSRALRELRISAPGLETKLPDMVARGLEKLYDMQHADGGWGWWKDDDTNPYLTAYVVRGLFQAKQAGFEVRDDVYKRGVAALKKLAAEDVGEFREASGEVRQRTMWSVKAYEIRVLALIGEDVHVEALAVDRHEDELNVFTQALLAETLWRVGETSRATALLEKIQGQAIETETTAHWDTKTISYSWVDDPVEATAAVLRTMLLVEPKSPQVDRVVRWLVAYRKGASWDTTRGTAAVIDVFTDLLVSRRSELSGESVAEVRLDGKAVGHVTMRRALAGGAARLEVPPALLGRGAHELEIRRIGDKGTLYWSASLESFLTTENLAAAEHGLVVARSYARVVSGKDDKGKPSTRLQPLAPGDVITVGARIRVTVSIKNAQPCNYVIVEDKLIPGCELVEAEAERNRAGGWWWVGREVHDDRYAVFVSRLERGEHKLEYEVRAEAAGTYHVRPAESYLMYTPDVRGRSAESTIRIQP
jgi:uncharacterized protein YfaS (alpha-2-macroglobulin family)